MRVLFLSQIVPYPPHGGVLQRGYNIIRELGSRAEVFLLAFVHPDVLPTAEAVAESRTALGHFCARIEYFPLWPKTSRLHQAAALIQSVGSAAPFSVLAHKSKACHDRVGWHLQHERIDLVHADTLALGPFVPERRDVAAVLTHHNIESVLMERRAEVDSRPVVRHYIAREARKLRDAERQYARMFDVNIVMSAHDEATLRARVPGVTTAVVPNGVDTSYFSPAEPVMSADLIYTGGMNMFANRDAVLYFLDEIWPLIARARPDARFLAVGQDPPPELRARAAADPRIIATGYVPDVRPMVRSAAVYVVPLRVGGGTRLKVLDAMASGKALVSTRIGCEGIEVRDGEHLIMADDPADFSAATVALLDDAARRAALGASARRLVEARYAWPEIGRRLESAYQQAIAAHGGRAMAAAQR